MTPVNLIKCIKVINQHDIIIRVTAFKNPHDHRLGQIFPFRLIHAHKGMHALRHQFQGQISVVSVIIDNAICPWFADLFWADTADRRIPERTNRFHMVVCFSDFSDDPVDFRLRFFQQLRAGSDQLMRSVINSRAGITQTAA